MPFFSLKNLNFFFTLCGALAMLALLAACSDNKSTSAVTPTIQSGTVTASTPGVGPTVVTVVTVTAGGTPGTATSTQGNSQVITLADRKLTIGKISKQAGSDASTMGIALTITVTDTGHTPIMNQATFYQLVGAEGDSFGMQSGVSANFYGSIPAGSSREGTIVFQVPTGAVKGLNLLYRPEVATETILLPLNT